MEGALKKRTVSVLVLLFFFFCETGFVFAQNSAMFEVTAPPSAQAGKEINFAIEIINAGREIWEGERYYTFVRIYDRQKKELTESEKIGQLEDIVPGEKLTTNIIFIIPVDYLGTYYYRVGLELEKETILSHYFTLKILPFVPEVKKWSGNVRISYQNDQEPESTTSLNLGLVDRLGDKSYLKFLASGQASLTINPQLNRFLISYNSEKLDISAGDFSRDLSWFTLSPARGIKVENRRGKVSLVGLIGSFQKTFTDELYGLRGSINLTDNLELAANYSKTREDEHSVNSLQAEFAITPEMTLSGEYAWSSYRKEDLEPKKNIGEAFQLSTSLDYERLTLDAYYEKVGEEFSFLGNPDRTGDYEEYDLSLTYSLMNYINGTIYYNRYRDGLSENSEIFVANSAEIDLRAAFPGLPALLLAYALDETYWGENGSPSLSDTTDTLRIGLSYPIGKARVSANYLRSSYRDMFEPTITESSVSTNYGISVPWGNRTNLSANYIIFSSENSPSLDRKTRQQVVLRSQYIIVPGKLVVSASHTIGRNKNNQGELENEKGTTNIGLSYYLTQKSVVQLGHTMTRSVDFITDSINFSDSVNAHFTYSHTFAKGHSLKIKYGLAGAGLDNGSKLYQNLRITYGYDF